MATAFDINIRYGLRNLQPSGTLGLRFPPDTIVPLCAVADAG